MPTLKAPFPAFGGKGDVAAEVWKRFDAESVKNFIEPFCNSAAVMLRRPGKLPTGAKETLNDVNHYIVNFWRAVQADADAVARFADWPVSEADMHARHRWLATSTQATAFRERIAHDPDFYDAKFAGWWVWGQCLWIGTGWCGLVYEPGEQRPALWKGQGVCQQYTGEPGPESLTTCEERREWLRGVMAQLSNRLRTARVCYGHWSRVCDSASTLDKLGITGVFLDPPYPSESDDGEESRDTELYGRENPDELLKLRNEVLDWCKRWGSNRKIRIAVCGYDTDGYAELERLGWDRWQWKAWGGYGNRGGANNRNARRETVWFSPSCVKPDGGLLKFLGADNPHS